MRKLKLEDLVKEDFDRYRRVIIFTDNYLEFPCLENARYFSLFQMQQILEDYFRIPNFQRIPYLFLFNFESSYNFDNFIEII